MNDLVTAATDEDLEQHASRASDPNWSIAKVIAIVLGAPVVAFTAGVLCIARLPVDLHQAFAWGLHAIVPLWIVLASALPLARRGSVALGACLALSVLGGLALWLGGAA
jgi:hypothetical protein